MGIKDGKAEQVEEENRSQASERTDSPVVK